MVFLTIVKVSLKSLLANRLRTALAMLGIIIGVASVVAMLAVGTGAQRDIMGRMSALGTNVLIVRSGNFRSRGVSQGMVENLKLEDAEAILAGVKNLTAISPVVSGSVQAKNLDKNSRTSLLGAASTYFKIRNFPIEKGRAISDHDCDELARVAVIGPTTATNLYGDENPVGKVVKINGVNFRVIGVTKAKGDQGWFSPDDQLFIPFTTAMKQVLGTDNLREIDIEMVEGTKSEGVVADVTKLLRKRHRLQDGQDDDFTIRNQSEMVETASQFAATIKLLLGSIAGISLLVGGIGIMNIMLVTVRERTREIGIRKAIGARRRDILLQFLIEAGILSSLGGVIGVIVGAAIVIGISKFGVFQAVLEPFSIIIAVSFAVATGVFFGFYPARVAAALNPIECLRYE